MKAGDLVQLSPRLANHGGRVVRIDEVERTFEGANRVERIYYIDPDGAKDEDGYVLRWYVLSHLAIRWRGQRPDYADQDRVARSEDRVRTRYDAALKMRLQQLGLVPVPRPRRYP